MKIHSEFLELFWPQTNKRADDVRTLPPPNCGEGKYESDTGIIDGCAVTFSAQACRRIQLLVAFMRLLDCSTFSISDKTRRRQVTEST